MDQLFDYNVYIFDCDGVLLDSNSSKITAMRKTLESIDCIEGGIDSAVKYFKENFGRSRYHHVEEFLRNHLLIRQFPYVNTLNLEHQILDRYSLEVTNLYKSSPIVPYVEKVLGKISNNKFVASGSEQAQLRDALSCRNLAHYFKGIFGSPVKKVDIVREIVKASSTVLDKHIVMIGDSVADLEAAHSNGIDFIGITKYSNAPNALIDRCREFDHRVILSWKDIEID